ncbi:MAG: TolC family protein [Verrucomicrobiia bacterium]
MSSLLPRLLRSLLFLAAIGALPCHSQQNERAPSDLREITVEQAIDIALERNPEILVARQEIARTLGLIVEVRSQVIPRASISGDFSERDEALIENRQFGASSSTQTWALTANIRQLIYSGGAVRAALEIARLTRDNSWFALVETVNRIITEVRRQYFNITLSRELITVEEESVALLEQELADQKNRFAAGTVPQFNVLRAEVELANAQPGLIAARNDYRIAQLRFARLLGVSLPDGSIGTDTPLYVPITPMEAPPYKVTLAEAQGMATLRRALLKQRRQDILIATENIRVQRAGYHPRIDAVGGYEIRSSFLDADWSNRLEGWFAGVQGSWNIFDGLETAGKVDQARADLGKAKIAYEDAMRQVKLEVQEAYSQLREAQELIQSQSKTVEQAREALRLAQARFSAGAGTQLEVFDARVALNRTQVVELRARFDYIVALAEIERATGTAFDFDTSFEDPLMKKRWVKKLLTPVADQPQPALQE